MSRRRAIDELSRTLDIMKLFENHIPPVPEAECFYTTYNKSVVYVYQRSYDGEALAVILKGGYGRQTPGDTYSLSIDGYHSDDDPGPHLVMALHEKLDLKIPDVA